MATLGTLFAFGSIGAVITDGNAIYVQSPFVLELAGGKVWGLVPYSFLILLVVCAICWLILRRLHMGRWIRAAGSNIRAAHVSGIDLQWVYLFLFIVSGAFTGLAGIILTGYLSSAVATQASKLQFERYRGRRRRWNQPSRRRRHALRDGIGSVAVCHGQQWADPCGGQFLLAVPGDWCDSCSRSRTRHGQLWQLLLDPRTSKGLRAEGGETDIDRAPLGRRCDRFLAGTCWAKRPLKSGRRSVLSIKELWWPPEA